MSFYTISEENKKRQAYVMKTREKLTTHKDEATAQNVILVGNANVGKSVIFGILTGSYVIVSNYPGTTVEISRGKIKNSGHRHHHHPSGKDAENQHEHKLGNHLHKKADFYNLIDTPGVASLLPMSRDEVITRDIILEEKGAILLQVADSKNLQRTFLISLQIAEMGLPFVLVMNMSDEARERRINIDYKKLSKTLGVEVIPTIAVSRTGTDKIAPALSKAAESGYSFKYDTYIEDAVEKISELLPDFPVSRRSIALMILAEDISLGRWLENDVTDEQMAKIQEIVRYTRGFYPDPLEVVINKERLQEAGRLAEQVAVVENTPRTGFMYNLGRICMHPVWGIPILMGVLALMYLFVGKLAAGDAVDFLQNTLFGNAVENTGIVIPFIAKIIKQLIPIPIVSELLVGQYGLISVGITYAIAIVLPIVAAFFLFFSLLEDSGYLPRLAIMADRACKVVGLNGKAILPMVLGLGCGTMAAISARILDTPRERVLVMLLLALGVPCSAQLGVIMGLLSGSGVSVFLIWLLIILGSMVVVGYIANKVLPGETSEFIMEIPPLRVPGIRNIVIKTLARIEWYLKEAVPLFMLATFILFIIDKTGFLSIVYKFAEPVVVNLLGLPIKATDTFIMGFLRRDYGAAGLLDMANHGLLTRNQVLVSMVTITLFLPCVAQLFIMIKEKNVKTAVSISLFVFVFAFSAGGLLNYILNLLRITL
ncbi:MAG: ferrous iron transport protein B [Firmicutes bacterium]|nr:ferrous iron transport protein B [Bacillota bacterium]